MAEIIDKKLHINGPCGSGEYCHLCKSRSWCKMADGRETAVKIEKIETDILPADGEGQYQVAFDIGTTTVAAALLNNGAVTAVTGKLNPHIKYGTDVITRAESSLRGNSEIMKRTLQEAIAGSAAELCEKAGVLPKQVKSGVITGNTTMLYILTGRNTKCLTAAPFKADWLGDCHIEIEGVDYYLPPCISAFVGADAVCGLLASGMTEQPESSLLADMGTNGEILLWHERRLLCCSTAAGPAFEGYGLSHGMAALPGAVEHVYSVGRRLIYKTIDDVEAKGICGSGIIDLIACLRQTGELEENGTLLSEQKFINNSDIRMIQLAKSAVCAGIITVLGKAGITSSQLKTLWLAGGFGKNINMQNAGMIGLFPFGASGKVQSLGNSALKGAVLLCRNEHIRNNVKNICAGAETVQLTEEPVFAGKFVECMALKAIL